MFALQIVPLQMALVPLLSLFSRGLTINEVTIFPGSTCETWITASRRCGSRTRSSRLPLAIFLLHNFIAEIPSEVIEAARVDGAGHGQIFFRIDPPADAPAHRLVRDLQFIWVWNDLLVATIFAHRRRCR